MKEILISNCEKNYVIKSLDKFTRVDGRSFNEFRKLIIEFGRDWGCCYVSLGKTKVLAQVSCEIQQPKSSRPQEGLLNINVELSPMAAPNFEAGRQSELSVHLNRILEKSIKDSKAVDLESLCIRQNEKVWSLRIDVNILNHEGNLLDCASIAALIALSHFKRPDVTSDGENIIVHRHEQRDPIPLTIHHFPICVSYAIFHESSVAIADPSLLEEGVADAQLVYTVNSYKEICTVHLGGSATTNANLILECASKAASRAVVVVRQIKEALDNDKKIRSENNPINFVIFTKDLETPQDELNEYLNRWNIKKTKRKKDKNKKKEEKMETEALETTETEPKETKEKKEKNSDHDSDSDVCFVPTEEKQIETFDIDDSEEEDVIILNPNKSVKK